MTRSRSNSTASTSSSPVSRAWVALGRSSATIANSSMTFASMASNSRWNSWRFSPMGKDYAALGNATVNAMRRRRVPAVTRWYPPPRSRLDGHLHPGDLADVRGDRALRAHPAGREHAERPRAGRGEEPETAVLAERNLGDELVTGAEQAGVARADGRAVAQHVALDDRLPAGRVLGDGHTARRRSAAVRAHRASPSSIVEEIGR